MLWRGFLFTENVARPSFLQLQLRFRVRLRLLDGFVLCSKNTFLQSLDPKSFPCHSRQPYLFSTRIPALNPRPNPDLHHQFNCFNTVYVTRFPC